MGGSKVESRTQPIRWVLVTDRFDDECTVTVPEGSANLLVAIMVLPENFVLCRAVAPTHVLCVTHPLEVTPMRVDMCVFSNASRIRRRHRATLGQLMRTVGSSTRARTNVRPIPPLLETA